MAYERTKKWKETHWTIAWLKLGNNKNNNKECQKNEKVVPLQRMTWAAVVEDMFLNFLHSFLTLMFEQRLLEFVVERWVCSVRVFIEFRTQRVPIYLPSNKVPTLGNKTMMWYHWFSKGSNQQLLCMFPFSINFFITFYVFFLKISCATQKGTTLATTRPCGELWLVKGWWDHLRKKGS